MEPKSIGNIRLIVTSDAGSYFSGAQIQLTSDSVKASGVSDSSGDAYFEGIATDHPLTLAVEADGYPTTSFEDIVLTPGLELLLNVTLQVESAE